MKVSKIIIPVILCVVLCLSWYTNIDATLKQLGSYNDCINMAESSIDEGLYEQAVEYYKDSLNYKQSIDTYYKIENTYDTYYKEEPTSIVRNLYIKEMQEASLKNPKCEEFWVKTSDLYMDALDYSAAFKNVKKAISYGAKGERLDALNTKLLYMVKEEFTLYSDFKTALNGYIVAYDGSNWAVLDSYGKPISENYKFIGLLNDDGKGIYVNDIDTRLLDKKEITRARYKFNAEDAGYYSESSGWIPVKIEGKWKYVNLSGELLEDSYDEAGSFFNHKAAVKQDDKWFLIDDDGNKIDNSEFEDLKLDLYGSYIQSNIVLGKREGKYHIYDKNLNQVSDFSCDDIDICIDDNPIAFEQDSQWGFVDSSGKIVLEPTYKEAKSFSNKMAAVKNASGKWGYINNDFKQVIENKYEFAFYFNSSDTTIISNKKGQYQIMHYLFS